MMTSLIGQQLGNYQVIRLLGHGGFAEVYLGEHIYLKSSAALKVLHGQLTNRDATLFVQEAQTLATLKHPYIVHVLDFAVQDGISFLVMEYAPNGTLRQLYPAGTRLSLGTVVSYVQRIASALQYAHGLRFIHRDVKPENMLLDERREVVLSDFGLALLLPHTNSMSTRPIDQSMTGTVPYMAPEQLQGKPEHASDQYALGIVVYEWLCGRRPFSGSSTEIAIQHLSMPPPSMREQVPQLSPAIEEVVLRALAKKPKERFSQVQDFASALEQSSQEALGRTFFTLPSAPGEEPPLRQQGRQILDQRAKPSSVTFPRDAGVPTIPPAYPSALPSIWTVPYRRNPYFTGREGELVLLANWLSTEGRLALSQSLSGLGGIGKTQLAVEYAYRFCDHYSAVLWVSADSRETLIADCTRLAAELKLPEQEDLDQNKLVTAIQRWLREQQDWLLILDNVEDLDLVTWFLPVQHKGNVLLTTRRQVTEPVAQAIAMDVLPEEEGALFLLRRTKSLPLDGSLDKATEVHRQTARLIARTLGGLPLALDQAGAYILETGCDLATYLVLYKQRQTRLLRRRGNVPSDHPLSVATTFTLAFEEVRRRSEAAIELLRLCAFLAPDAIAEEIIIEGATYLGSELQSVVAEAYALNEVIEVLRTFSLIKRDPVEKLLNIHRLVQAVLQDALEEAERRSWAERAIYAVNAAFPHVQPDAWPQCERLLTQALAATQVIERYQLISEETGRLLYETATYLLERGARYAEAEMLYQRALAIWEQQVGVEHPLIATVLNSLAILYKEQGKYEEAKELYQRAIVIGEKTLGPENARLAKRLNNLALVYFEQGKYEQAEPLYQRALAIWEQQVGVDDPDSAIPLNNLGELYAKQGKYAEAESLYQRALATWEQQVGTEHLYVGSPLNNLGELYTEQGRYAEAEPLLQRALAIWEQQLGQDHPFVAHPLHGLAMLYCEQGKYAEAELLYRRALHIRLQALGPEHAETAETMSGLGRLWESQGNSEMARAWYSRALAIHEQILGVHHPKTIKIRKRFLALLHAMGQYEEATQFERSQPAEGKNAEVP